MKPNIVRGNSFLGLLKYTNDENKGGQIVGGNMTGSTAAELSKEFAVARSLRPDVKRPVWHCSLSLTSGENLSPEKWREIIDDFMQEMGFGDHNQFTANKHDNTQYEHVHIAASRIGLDGTLWHGQNDVRQAIDVCQELEKKHGLTITPGLEYYDKQKAELKAGELEMAIRLGNAPPKQVIQIAIDTTLKQSCCVGAFIVNLQQMGVSVLPNIASTGRMNGFSFEYEGIAFKGSKLGKSYSWGNLLKRGLNYNEEWDTAMLMNLKANYEQNEQAESVFPADMQVLLDDLHKEYVERRLIREAQKYIIDEEIHYCDDEPGFLGEEPEYIDEEPEIIAALEEDEDDDYRPR